MQRYEEEREGMERERDDLRDAVVQLVEWGVWFCWLLFLKRRGRDEMDIS